MIVIAAAMAGYAGAAAAYAYAEECAEDDDDDPEALQTALQAGTFFSSGKSRF